MSNEQQVRIYNPSEEMVKNAAVSGMDGYRALCKEAEDDYEAAKDEAMSIRSVVEDEADRRFEKIKAEAEAEIARLEGLEVTE